MAKQSTTSFLNLNDEIAQIILIAGVSLRRKINQIQGCKILQCYKAYME